MKLLACQLSINHVETIQSKQEHVKRLIRIIHKECYKNGPIDLIVLPELSTISYSQKAFQNLDQLAEPLYGETYTQMASLAKAEKCYIAYGLPLVLNDAFTISQVVIDPAGTIITHYCKIHLTSFGTPIETDFFQPGNDLSVFSIQDMTVGIVICYDFRFPCFINQMAKRFHIDLMIHPVAFSIDSTFNSWHHFAICRAIENQQYWISLNRAGSQCGQSIFCYPWYDSQNNQKPFVFDSQERCYVFDIDHSLLQTIRQTYPFFKDDI